MICAKRYLHVKFLAAPGETLPEAAEITLKQEKEVLQHCTGEDRLNRYQTGLTNARNVPELQSRVALYGYTLP